MHLHGHHAVVLPRNGVAATGTVDGRRARLGRPGWIPAGSLQVVVLRLQQAAAAVLVEADGAVRMVVRTVVIYSSRRCTESGMSTGPDTAGGRVASRRWRQTARTVATATTSPKTMPANTNVAMVAAAPATPSTVSNGAAQHTAHAAAPAPTRCLSLNQLMA
jgi:hypothetical protein